MRNLRHTSFILLLIGLHQFSSSAQVSTLSLKDCQQMAMQHISVLQADMAVSEGELRVQQQRNQQLPIVQLESQMGSQFGRNIDPTTNGFTSGAILFNSVNASGQWTLFQGGYANHAQHYQQALLSASRADAEATRFQLSIQVVNAFAQALLAEEQVKQLEYASAFTLDQLHKIESDIALGVRAAKEQIHLQAQLAAEQRSIVDAKGRLQQARLLLGQLTHTTIQDGIQLIRPDDSDWKIATEYSADFQTTDDKVLAQHYPGFRAAELRQKATAYEISMAKSANLPNIKLFAQVGTRFSSAARQFNGYSEALVEQPVWLQGVPTTLSIMQAIPQYANVPMFNQWNNNFGQALGIQISMPLANQRTSDVAIQRAKLNAVTQQLAARQQQEWFSNELANARAKLQHAQSAFFAAKTSVNLANQAFTIALDAYQIGSTSSYELLEARKVLETEQARLLNAKYECYFFSQLVRIFTTSH